MNEISLIVPPRKPLTDLQRAELFLRHDGRCYLCGLKIETFQTWHDEHVHARSLGGDDELANRRPAHDECHAVKTKKDKKARSKMVRLAKKRAGMRGRKRKGPPMPGSRDSKWRKPMNGPAEPRR